MRLIKNLFQIFTKLLILFSLLFTSLSLVANELSGLNLISEAIKRQTVSHEHTQQMLILLDSKKNKSIRKLNYYHHIDNQQQRVLIKFDEPREIRDSAVSFDYSKNKEPKAFIYLPAISNSVRQLSLTDNKLQNTLLLDTDLYLSDFITEQTHLYKYNKIAEKHIDGRLHYLVEALPITEQSNHIARRVLYIVADSLYLVRTDEFDKDNTLYRQLFWRDLKLVAKNKWRAEFIEVNNHKLHHKTIIRIIKRRMSEDFVPESLFDNISVKSKQ